MHDLLRPMLAALDLAEPARLRVVGAGSLPSAFRVTELATASVAAAGASLATLAGGAPEVTLDRELASHWFAGSLRPDGWAPPPPWDPIAGDYETRDAGWIRLHTNAPHHRAAALRVLGGPAEPDAVARRVRKWGGDELEEAVVDAGGAAAVLRSVAEWQRHPQGRAVGAEPLMAHEMTNAGPDGPAAAPTASRPLAGVRVLDLTRVLAGPVATRLLAGWGADVLRIDPPGWDEPGVVPEVMLGKRTARLDLGVSAGRERFTHLLGDADVLVHGYRSDALERLALGAAERERIRPGLVDVALDAYGWSGPWRRRRGFDSLVQMSCGIAAAGMRASAASQPRPLPVQALDHATGYLMAAAALRGLDRRRAGGPGSRWRLSLARTAALLIAAGPQDPDAEPIVTAPPLSDAREQTGWGPARRLAVPVSVAGAPLGWDRPARPLGSDQPAW